MLNLFHKHKNGRPEQKGDVRNNNIFLYAHQTLKSPLSHHQFGQTISSVNLTLLPFLTRQRPVYFFFPLVHMPPPANHAGKMGVHEINRKETHALILGGLSVHSFLSMTNILGYHFISQNKATDKQKSCEILIFSRAEKPVVGLY